MTPAKPNVNPNEELLQAIAELRGAGIVPVLPAELDLKELDRRHSTGWRRLVDFLPALIAKPFGAETRRQRNYREQRAAIIEILEREEKMAAELAGIYQKLDYAKQDLELTEQELAVRQAELTGATNHFKAEQERIHTARKELGARRLAELGAELEELLIRHPELYGDPKFNIYFESVWPPVPEPLTTAVIPKDFNDDGCRPFPPGWIKDRHGKFYNIYDLCTDVFDGDLDLSDFDVITLGPHCKKITGSVFNGKRLLSTGAVVEIGGDLRSCPALQRTRVKKLGGNLAGLLALKEANELEEVGGSVLILPQLLAAPNLRHVGRDLYLNSTAIARVLDCAQIGCIKLPDDHSLPSVAAMNDWLAIPANTLHARRAAKGGRIDIGGDEWRKLIAIQQIGDILPDGTILYAKQDNQAWITTPKNLPKLVSLNELAKHATKEDIKAQNINIHAQFIKQGMDDHGRTDWFLPKANFRGEGGEACELYYAGMEKGYGSRFAHTFYQESNQNEYVFLTAYCINENNVYIVDVDHLGKHVWGPKDQKFPVRPVRIVPLEQQGAALVI